MMLLYLKKQDSISMLLHEMNIEMGTGSHRRLCGRFSQAKPLFAILSSFELGRFTPKKWQRQKDRRL
jgi:hypothetical protein